MPKAIQLRVVTAEGQALADEAVSIVAPGALGYLGILSNHAPLVTTLQPGKLAWRRPNDERLISHLTGGLLEVAGNRVTILTEQLTQPSAAKPAAHSI